MFIHLVVRFMSNVMKKDEKLEVLLYFFI